MVGGSPIWEVSGRETCVNRCFGGLGGNIKGISELTEIGGSKRFKPLFVGLGFATDLIFFVK